jgi:hypothetical protein
MFSLSTVRSPQFLNARLQGLAHVIAMQAATLTGQAVPVPPQAIRTLVLMRKFHIFLGFPSYDIGEHNHSVLFHLTDEMLGYARSLRRDGEDPTDIPYSCGLEHVPCVPSWSVEEIQLFRAQEAVDPWVGEKYWVRERVQDASRLGKDLSRMLAQVEALTGIPTCPYMLGSRVQCSPQPPLVCRAENSSFAFPESPNVRPSLLIRLGPHIKETAPNSSRSPLFLSLFRSFRVPPQHELLV